MENLLKLMYTVNELNVSYNGWHGVLNKSILMKSFSDRLSAILVMIAFLSA